MPIKPANRNCVRQILYFASYLSANFASYVAFISIAAFFHFLLGHRLSDIENWIFDKNWVILGLGRLISVFFIFKFLSVRFEERRPLQKIFRQFRGNLKSEIVASFVFLFVAFIFLGQPRGSANYPSGLSKMFISYLGPLAIILSDCFIILLLNLIYPLNKKQWWANMAGMALSSAILSGILFQSSLQNTCFLFFGMFMAYWLLKYEDRFEYLHSLLFGLTFFSPMIALFGLDPLWEKNYAFLPMTQNIEILHLFILGGVVLTYLTWKKTPPATKPIGGLKK